MSYYLKTREFLKYLFWGLIFIFLIFIFSPNKEKKVFPINLEQSALKGPHYNSFTLFLTKSQSEKPRFLLIKDFYLKSISPPFVFTPKTLGALIVEEPETETRKIITEYIVEPGDSLYLIANKFNLNLNTILWANDLKKDSTIKPGQKLIIPPIDGVIHYVKSGDTISEIAKQYNAKIQDIISFNELSSEGDIFIGDVLIIPNGSLPAPKPKPSTNLVPLASNYFIYPTVSRRITQGLHWYNAVDFGGQCGDPIFAVAGGKVLKVKLSPSTSRWVFGGAGNHLTILHPNGVVTMYGHILTSFVNPGDEVSQGQIIALMGGQPGTPGAGMSTGCHLHFSVSGAKNPFAK